MARKVSVVLTGDRELDRKLRALTSTKAKRAVRKACREALRPIQKATRADAPRGATGKLSRAAKLRALKRSRKRIGARVTIEGQGPKAPAQEYGTKKMAGRHFMYDAAESRRNEANLIFKHKAQEMIKELTS